MDKIKRFCKNNKSELHVVAGVTMMVVAAGMVGYGFGSLSGFKKLVEVEDALGAVILAVRENNVETLDLIKKMPLPTPKF